MNLNLVLKISIFFSLALISKTGCSHKSKRLSGNFKYNDDINSAKDDGMREEKSIVSNKTQSADHDKAQNGVTVLNDDYFINEKYPLPVEGRDISKPNSKGVRGTKDDEDSASNNSKENFLPSLGKRDASSTDVTSQDSTTLENSNNAPNPSSSESVSQASAKFGEHGNTVPNLNSGESVSQPSLSLGENSNNVPTQSSGESVSQASSSPPVKTDIVASSNNPSKAFSMQEEANGVVKSPSNNESATNVSPELEESKGKVTGSNITSKHLFIKEGTSNVVEVPSNRKSATNASPELEEKRGNVTSSSSTKSPTGTKSPVRTEDGKSFVQVGPVKIEIQTDSSVGKDTNLSVRIQRRILSTTLDTVNGTRKSSVDENENDEKPQQKKAVQLVSFDNREENTENNVMKLTNNNRTQKLNTSNPNLASLREISNSLKPLNKPDNKSNNNDTWVFKYGKNDIKYVKISNADDESLGSGIYYVKTNEGGMRNFPPRLTCGYFFHLLTTNPILILLMFLICCILIMVLLLTLFKAGRQSKLGPDSGKEFKNDEGCCSTLWRCLNCCGGRGTYDSESNRYREPQPENLMGYFRRKFSGNPPVSGQGEYARVSDDFEPLDSERKGSPRKPESSAKSKGKGTSARKGSVWDDYSPVNFIRRLSSPSHKSESSGSDTPGRRKKKGRKGEPKHDKGKRKSSISQWLYEGIARMSTADQSPPEDSRAREEEEEEERRKKRRVSFKERQRMHMTRPSLIVDSDSEDGDGGGEGTAFMNFITCKKKQPAKRDEYSTAHLQTVVSGIEVSSDEDEVSSPESRKRLLERIVMTGDSKKIDRMLKAEEFEHAFIKQGHNRGGALRESLRPEGEEMDDMEVSSYSSLDSMADDLPPGQVMGILPKVKSSTNSLCAEVKRSIHKAESKTKHPKPLSKHELKANKYM